MSTPTFAYTADVLRSLHDATSHLHRPIRKVLYTLVLWRPSYIQRWGSPSLTTQPDHSSPSPSPISSSPSPVGASGSPPGIFITRLCLHASCTPLAVPPAADYVPYWCHGLEVYPGSCSGLPPRSLLSNPGTRGRSSLRSSKQGLFFVPFARTSTTQARAFSVWNGLPLL